MKTYEEILDMVNEDNLYVMEKVSFESNSKGLINGNVIGLSDTLETSAEKSCVLAEEYGHYKTSVGDITNMKDAWSRKQEAQARFYGYNLKIGLLGIVKAFEHGCRYPHEFAEYLNVTPQYLAEAIECYKQKYGTHVLVDNYVVYFLPTISFGKML